MDRKNPTRRSQRRLPLLPAGAALSGAWLKLQELPLRGFTRGVIGITEGI